MSSFFEPYAESNAPARGPAPAALVDYQTQVRLQYARVREYCGYTIDELINSREASRYVQELWLVGCMVRQPEKAAFLPQGNEWRAKSRMGSPPQSTVRDRNPKRL